MYCEVSLQLDWKQVISGHKLYQYILYLVCIHQICFYTFCYIIMHCVGKNCKLWKESLNSDGQPTKPVSPSHTKSLNTKRTTTYVDGSASHGMLHAYKCSRIKSVESRPSDSGTGWISTLRLRQYGTPKTIKIKTNNEMNTADYLPGTKTTI